MLVDSVMTMTQIECVHERERVCACVRACVCVCVRVCVRAWASEKERERKRGCACIRCIREFLSVRMHIHSQKTNLCVTHTSFVSVFM